MVSSSNLPRFHEGWTDSQGKVKQGFWEVRHNGRYVALTKYFADNDPAIHANHSKRNTNAAIAARDKFLADQSRKAYEADLTAQVEANRVVAVFDVVSLY